MTAAHTEGPWTYAYCATPDGYEGGITRAAEGDETVFYISVRKGTPAAQNLKANLRLACTAPRMLIALQECHELLAVICEVCCDNPPPGGIDKLENARRAIAEATGTGEWA